MKKIITAIGTPEVNEKLKQIKEFEIIGNDIQYQEGILDILEKEKDIDFLILSELIPGNISIENLIKKIKNLNNNIKIIIILEKEKIKLEEFLKSENIFSIIYNNKIEINEIIKLIKNKKETENEKIKKELEELKEIIINQNNKKIKNNYLINLKNIYKKNIINNLINKNNKKNNNKISKKNNNKEIISILGTSGVGKSIFTINLSKSFIYSNKKILIIDFDILNNSLHTILGLKKYPEKLRKKLNKNKLYKFDIKDLIIKINKKLDLISGINLLFDSKYEISSQKINSIFSELKRYYDVIIIDTSSECFLEYTKEIIKNSNINIFIIEPNLLEIKKSKNLLNIYTNEWKIKKENINILFNKFSKNSIDINLLKIIFQEFNIIGKIKSNEKYNLIINKNAKKIDKKIIKEYLLINNKILKSKLKNNNKFQNKINKIFINIFKNNKIKNII